MTVTDNTPVRNGVDTATLFATLDAVKGQPELAKFQFRVANRWISGTHNRGTINGYFGAGQEHVRAQHSPTTSTIRRCWWAATTGPHARSTSCMRSPPA